MKVRQVSLAVCLLALAGAAEAARFKVMWKNPSTHTDGTPLTDLSYVDIEVGTCLNGGLAFGTYLGGSLVATSAAGADMSTYIEVQGQTQVCLRAYAADSKGVKSAYSNIAVKNLLPIPGKPITLGQPVILSWNKE